jgi:hypothetical protein
VSQPVEFDITLERTGVTATVLKPPFSVEKTFGAKGGVLVRGTIDGVPFRTQLFPIGDGTHYMVVNRAMKAQINKDAGDTVHVVMQVDTEPRTVEVPEDFAAALAENADAETKFNALSVSQRREYVKWIEDAKKPETRARRITQAVEMIAAGEKFK